LPLAIGSSRFLQFVFAVSWCCSPTANIVGVLRLVRAYRRGGSFGLAQNDRGNSDQPPRR